MGRTIERSPVATRVSAAGRSRLRFVLASVALVLVVVSLWGYGLQARGVQLHLGVIPLFGAFRFRPTIGLCSTVVTAAVIVTTGPRLAATLRFRPLLLACWAAAAAWAVALATATGAHRVTAPLTSRFDYWAAMPAVRQLGLGRFVRTYLDRLDTYPVHVQGHPPGLLVLYGALDHVGLTGPGWAAAGVVAIGTSGVVAVLVVARAVAGEDAARRAAPFLVLAPMALFVATTGDAVFLALAAWSVALLVVAAEHHRPALAVAAGGIGAMTLYFTYGLVPLLAALGAMVLWRWRSHAAGLALAAEAGAVPVVVAWTAAGFWWLDGLEASHHFYGVRGGNDRPYGYFLVANLAVFAVMLGPAGIAGLTRVAQSRIVPLVIAALVAVGVADVSGLSKAEVERIWLPFLPWVLLATATLARAGARRWLAAQAMLAIVLQLTIAWPW
jgi:methylthioxylose transferase